MATIDANAWYQITETRVNFSSSLQSQGGQGVFFALECGSCVGQKWQIQPVANSQYQLRNLASGISKQLSVCYTQSETDLSKTQPCMLPASGDDSQKWKIDAWGDGTFRFTNVANGSNYNMDCHPGNPLFMSSETAATPNQPAQHWLFSSIGAVADGAYSTTVATTTTAASIDAKTTATALTLVVGTQTVAPGTTITATSAASSKSSSLSTGAAAGLGVGIGLLFAVTLALLAFLLHRNKKRKNEALRGGQYANGAYSSEKGGWQNSGATQQSIDGKVASNATASELPVLSVAYEMESPPVEMPSIPRGTERKTPSLEHSDDHP